MFTWKVRLELRWIKRCLCMCVCLCSSESLETQVLEWADLVLDRWLVTFPTPIPNSPLWEQGCWAQWGQVSGLTGVGVTFGLRPPLGQHPVPLCLRTKDAIPFWREGRKEGGHVKLTDLETEKRGGHINQSYGPEN